MALASPALAVRFITASATWEAYKEYILRNNKNNNESHHFLSLCSVPGPKLECLMQASQQECLGMVRIPIVHGQGSQLHVP